MSSAAYSPDGKLLAFGSGLGGNVGPGTVVIYDVATRKERAEIGQLWNVATGELQPLGWPKDHHHLEGLSISPDSKLMAI